MSYEDEIRFVTCPECGHEQGDMGTRVACEECGYGPMPSWDYPDDSPHYAGNDQ